MITQDQAIVLLRVFLTKYNKIFIISILLMFQIVQITRLDMHRALQKQIKAIFKEGEAISVLNCEVYQSDLECLRQYQWLRSQSITLLCAIFQHEHKNLFLSSPPQQSLLCLQPVKFIYPSIASMLIQMGGEQFILQSMQSQNLFAYRYLLIPSNTQTTNSGKGNHWFLMIYDTIENQMWTMDSAYQCVHKNAWVMGERLGRMKEIFQIQKKRVEQLEKIENNGQKIKQLLDLLTKKRQFKASWLKNIVKQQNNYDCGIYACGNAQRFLNKLQQQLVKYPQILKQKEDEPKKILDQIKIMQLKPWAIEVDSQFFRDLRLRYFSKVMNVLKQSTNCQ